jgi:hypothetical protein
LVTIVGLSCMGYAIVMLVSTVVLAAVWTNEGGVADGFMVWSASIFWPLAIVCFFFYGIGWFAAPLGRLLLRTWHRSVVRLNPSFREMK